MCFPSAEICLGGVRFFRHLERRLPDWLHGEGLRSQFFARQVEQDTLRLEAPVQSMLLLKLKASRRDEVDVLL